MKKTKKEHYVPQCYLRNFCIKGNDKKINVFDKQKEQTRLNQNILDNASERYFYDIDIDKILNEASEEKRKDMLSQLGDKYDVYKNDKEQHIEKLFSEVIEGDYSEMLKSIIYKAETATPWYLKNCYSMSEVVKIKMAVCITFQFLRTKKSRDMLQDGMIKMYKVLLTKLYNIEYGNSTGNISVEDIDVSIGKEAMKLEHVQFMLDIDRILEFTKCFLNHVWVIYINKTEIPFWTSDAPVALNPMQNGWRSGRGIAAEGIEIILPLSDKVCLGMYDREYYGDLFYKATVKEDRIYIEIDDCNKVNSFNELQVRESYRCIFSSNQDFTLAKELCEKYPSIK
ncbi:MAG: DUF4238 domain-containing protein [Terrisporobacter sp.]|uniref:DUF4238 domain-containing protein n=1 Tax=Terrisporobacter sp. TaxID=1965305 RepID=UPI003993AE44